MTSVIGCSRKFTPVAASSCAKITTTPLALFGDKVLLAFGQNYSERSMELLAILVLVGIPSTLERIYFAVLRVYGRVREVLVWRTVISVTVLSASLYAVSVAGLVGIGWAVFGAHAAVATLIVVTRTGMWLRNAK